MNATRAAVVAACAYFVGATGCGVSVVAHDAEAAARMATEFAIAAFVRGDVAAAHSMLADRTRSTLSGAELGNALAAMHPQTRPVAVDAREWERVPGQPMIYVYLEGHAESERFYYRLVMEGSAGSGYRVAGLFRGSGPYPASPLRASLEAPPGTR